MSWTTRNTALAAALITLGYKHSAIRPDGTAKCIEFEDKPDPAIYANAWAEWKDWQKDNADHPFTYMRKVSDARNWIISRVIHGDHNVSLAIPEGSFTTDDLKLACCLVASGYYLYTLDKTTRLFHFTSMAETLKDQYYSSNNSEESPVKWMKKYLAEYEKLNREIKQQG